MPIFIETALILGSHRSYLREGEISFSASDILNTFGIRQEIVGEGFTATYENYYETQVFRIGMKYKF